jgi:hypothetical protein
MPKFQRDYAGYHVIKNYPLPLTIQEMTSRIQKNPNVMDKIDWKKVEKEKQKHCRHDWILPNNGMIPAFCRKCQAWKPIEPRKRTKDSYRGDHYE